MSWSLSIFITTLLVPYHTHLFPSHGIRRSLVLLGTRGEVVAAEVEGHPIRPSSEASFGDLGTSPGDLRPYAEEAVAVARGLGIQPGEAGEQGNPPVGGLEESSVGVAVVEAEEGGLNGRETPAHDGEVSVQETETCCTSDAPENGRVVYRGLDSC